MPGKVYRLRWQPTSSGGSISEEMSSWTQIVNGAGRLNHIFLKASRPTTVFNFTIISPTGNRIFPRKNIVGELNEEKDLLMKGTYTLILENVNNGQVTVDDTFEGEFMFEDVKDK